MCQVQTDQINETKSNERKRVKRPIVWVFVFYWLFVHIIGPYGLYQFICAPHLATLLWGILMLNVSTHGSVAGAHRYWSHRAFKAKLPLRLYLAFAQTLSFQGSIFQWVRDHRSHHKYVDTTADPHNVKQGFFYSHIGWTMMKKHPDVEKKGANLDLSDVKQDQIVMFQKNYYLILAPICSFLLPALVPWYFWGESFLTALNFCGVFRYFITTHTTGLINSYAHTFGTRPYDRHQRATDSSFVAQMTQGDGWHNYHHAFPWDYKAAELDNYSGNLNLALLHLMAKIGWAYDLRSATPEMIENQCRKRGDYSRPVRHEHLLRDE